VIAELVTGFIYLKATKAETKTVAAKAEAIAVTATSRQAEKVMAFSQLTNFKTDPS